MKRGRSQSRSKRNNECQQEMGTRTATNHGGEHLPNRYIAVICSSGGKLNNETAEYPLVEQVGKLDWNTEVKSHLVPEAILAKKSPVQKPFPQRDCK